MEAGNISQTRADLRALVSTGLSTGEPVLAGTSAIVDGEVVELSDIESRLLAALVRSPNVVMSKLDLSREVWSDETLDPHVVEVTIARLRRRLGSHGASIASVHRRGYTPPHLNSAAPELSRPAFEAVW